MGVGLRPLGVRIIRGMGKKDRQRIIVGIVDGGVVQRTTVA